MRLPKARPLPRTTLAGLLTGLLAGSLSVLPATAASADPPVVLLSNLCGIAELDWDTGTIGGDSWPTVVLRDGARIDEFTMHERGDRRYGATDGDVFTLRRTGLPDLDLVHDAPDGCEAPLLTVRAAADCAGLRLTLANAGTEPITGLRLHSVLDTSPAGTALPPVAGGSGDLTFALPDATPYALFSGPAGSDAVLWLSGVHRVPDGCATPSPSAVVTTPSTGGGSAAPSASAVEASASDGGGPGLPVTGDRTLAIGVAGLVLVVGGGGLLHLARRRRRLTERMGA